jgi:hypothetical protein
VGMDIAEMRASIKKWRHRAKTFLRVAQGKRKDRRITALQRILISIGLGVLVDLVLIFLIIVVGQYGLLDLRTIISVVLPEVGIGVFLYYFLGQGRRERLGEITDIMDIYTKVSHLKVYTFSVWGTSFYYVENTTTNQAYNASDFIMKVVNQGILQPIDCKNEREVKRIFKKKGTKLNKGEPSLADLANQSKKLIKEDVL